MAIPVGFAQCRIPFVGAAAETYGVVTFGVDQAIDMDGLEVAEAVWEAFEGSMLSRLDSSFTAGPVQVSIGTSAGDLSSEGTSSALGPRNDQVEAPNVAMLIQKRTALGGRKNRGRNFWPFMLSQDDVTEFGALSSVARADSQDAADAFLGALATNSVPMVLFHSDESVPTLVTALVVEGRAATQRRRLRR